MNLIQTGKFRYFGCEIKRAQAWGRDGGTEGQTGREGERERKTERERQREREGGRDRQTDRDRETERETDRMALLPFSASSFFCSSMLASLACLASCSAFSSFSLSYLIATVDRGALEIHGYTI